MADFKSSEQFQQHLATQSQEVMIAMLLKVLTEVLKLSPSFPMEQLECLKLLQLWDVVESTMTPADASIPPSPHDDVVAEPAVEKVNSQVVRKK